MKTVILAGGYGTRLSEETGVRPKPMVEIGGMPILWHIMKTYSFHGFNDFIICCGYRGFMIKEFFASYFLRTSDVTFDLEHDRVHVLRRSQERWQVTLVDTGEKTMTGGRLKRVAELIGDSTFFLTYGDGLSDIDFQELLRFHQEQGTLATLTAVRPPGRFGAFSLIEHESRVTHFREKASSDEAWINGGFFVLDGKVLDYIEGDATVWEQEPMTRLAHAGQLSAYRHGGFWQNMDTLRDKNVLEDLWAGGHAPWKKW